MEIHKIHQNPQQLQTSATEKTTEAIKVSQITLSSKLDDIKEAVKEISITKEIKIDFTKTNELLKKLAEREDEPVEVSVKLNII